MEKINPMTANITQENIEKLIELFPYIATETADADGNVHSDIDLDALRELIGTGAEGQRERYQFTWPGKRAAKEEARRIIDKTMRPERERSDNWYDSQNLYIEGDNLDALKILRSTYAGRIRLIYIDPPYNTGHDFVYDDDFVQTNEEYDISSGNYDEHGGRLVANLEGNGRFHSDWCSMIYPRLLLARDLLCVDGAIFISIDDHELMNLRKICDEVFGSSCFVGDVSWQRTYSPRNDSKGIPAEVEHLIVYSKTPGWIPGRLPRTEAMDARYKSIDNDPIPWKSGDALAADAIAHQGMVYAIQHPFDGSLLYPASGNHWRMGQTDLLKVMNEWAPYELKDLHDDDKRAILCGVSEEQVRKGVKAIVLSKSVEESRAIAEARYKQGNWPILYFTSKGLGGLARKQHLDNMAGRAATNLWPYAEVGHSDEAKKELKALFGGNAPFDTPKPVRLMQRIVEIASDKDSVIMDFFSGSASMAHAVMQKNAEDGGTRKFILVQIPEETTGEYANLCEIGEERIRRAGAKIVAEVEEANRQLKLGEEPKPVPDVGFRVLRIDSSNFTDTYATPDGYDQDQLHLFEDNVKPDRSDLDLLFQVLPTLRIPYSATIEEIEVCGKRAFDVNHGQLVACFDVEVGADCIEQIAKMRPIYAVFRDASMADDATEANFEELFKTFSPDTVRKVI